MFYEYLKIVSLAKDLKLVEHRYSEIPRTGWLAKSTHTHAGFRFSNGIKIKKEPPK